MAHSRITVAAGQPFNIAGNIVTNSVSGSWADVGNAVNGRAVRIQGVYWSSQTIGAKLYIRDRLRVGAAYSIDKTDPGPTWYEAECFGGPPALDLFAAHLTLFTPFEYLDTEGGNTIIIYGEYV